MKDFSRRLNLKFAAAFVAVLVLPCSLPASDWPHWRGPTFDGKSTENVPAALPASLPLLWKTNVGTGFATVSVLGRRVLTIGNRDNVDTVHCLDAETGRVLWQHSYPCELDARYYEGGPSATPTIHDGSVYTLSKRGHVFRLDLATGRVIWRRDLVADHDFKLPEWGFASSPFIDGAQVLLNVGRGGIALAKDTGATLWMGSTETAGYATVVRLPGDPADATHLLFSARALVGFEAATGRQFWELPVRSPREINAADPIVRGNRVLVSSSLGTKLLALEGAAAPRLLWEQKDLKWYFNAGVVVGEHVYSVNGTTHRPTELTCTEWATGKTVWSEPRHGSGALMAAGDTIILFDLGILTLFDASPAGFQPRLQQKLLDGTCWTVPVLANGRIYCRNADGDLVCVDVRAPGTSQALRETRKSVAQ